MTKICFPHYALGEYDSLKNAICSIKKMNDGWLGRTLNNIIQYNLCYRDHLREFGLDSLIERLFMKSTAIFAHVEYRQSFRFFILYIRNSFRV